jgi:hypothetical protein
MGNLLVLFTIERLSYDQALHASPHACELLIAKEMVGASGFEPPSSWSRTVRQIGSAQEFVEAHILGRFLKNDEFGLGDRHALCLEQ